MSFSNDVEEATYFCVGEKSRKIQKSFRGFRMYFFEKWGVFNIADLKPNLESKFESLKFEFGCYIPKTRKHKHKIQIRKSDFEIFSHICILVQNFAELNFCRYNLA